LMAAERLRPGARERDLADRGGGLAVLELERAFRQLEHAAAQGNGTRRHNEDVALARMQRRDVGRERGEPCLFDAAALGVNKQRRPDLDDNTAEIGEARGAHGVLRGPRHAHATNSAPAAINNTPNQPVGDSFSPSRRTPRIATKTTLSLSIGATCAALPILSARK